MPGSVMPKHDKIANQVTNIKLLHGDDYPEMPKNTTTARYGHRELFQYTMSATCSRKIYLTTRRGESDTPEGWENVDFELVFAIHAPA